MMHWGGYGWPMMFGGFFGLVILICVVLFIFWAVRRSSGYHGWMPPAGGSDALDIARQRYAKGEISKAEFDEIKKNLQ